MKAHWSDQPEFTIFHAAALSALDKRLGKNFSSPVFSLVKGLAPGAQLSSWTDEERSKFQTALTAFASPLLNKLGHNDDDTMNCLRGQLGKWVSRLGALAIPDPIPEAIPYWFDVAIHVPLLSQVAIAIHSIVPSEASVERSFSHQSLVHSELRTRLEDGSVLSLMRVRMNVMEVFEPNKKQKV